MEAYITGRRTEEMFTGLAAQPPSHSPGNRWPRHTHTHTHATFGCELRETPRDETFNITQGCWEGGGEELVESGCDKRASGPYPVNTGYRVLGWERSAPSTRPSSTSEGGEAPEYCLQPPGSFEEIQVKCEILPGKNTPGCRGSDQSSQRGEQTGTEAKEELFLE